MNRPTSNDDTGGSRATEDAVERSSGVNPDLPTELGTDSWLFVGRKTVREFLEDECTDLAAALTYYAVLALFPAALAVLSLVGLVGQGPKTVRTLVQILEDLGATSAADTLEPTLTQLSHSANPGLALLLGLGFAVWSASGYVAAFGRGMNRVWEVAEGRPFWKLRPTMMLVTVITMVLTAIVALGLVLTGPAARAVGNAVGLGSTAVSVWGIVKWPVLLFAVVLIVALLYYATPNVQQPKFHWISVGSLLAILTWVVASALFGLYVSHFSSYDRTYGSLAGVVVFLLWLWLTNLALLFGAELDAELERARQLQAGLPAEETMQLPVRDTTNIDKAEEAAKADAARGRDLRTAAAPDDD